MRLTEFEIEAIKKAFADFFSEHDHLWLFGSRVDDKKKGGDIDLYIETIEIDYSIAVEKKRKFLFKIEDTIGEQKIDIVLNLINVPSKKEILIYKVARETGIQLV